MCFDIITLKYLYFRNMTDFMNHVNIEMQLEDH